MGLLYNVAGAYLKRQEPAGKAANPGWPGRASGVINNHNQRNTMTAFKIEGRMDELDVEKALSDDRVERSVRKILIELVRAENLHPVWPTDVVHQIAIVAEESGEAMRAALRSHYKEGGTVEQLRTELIQTGAMVIRALKNLEV